ncbi:MAG TPA: pyridoxamine 5'-phosphate oxidase family protein [Candidatus Acidoferrales bacterium]|nr:pyridoxamine 5'-phosphate oxidase family protein [Candidatus Acidoferrales bacterium]
MSEREPVSTKNLTIYGEGPLRWERVRHALAAGQDHRPFFLATVGANGRAHVAGTGAIWDEGDIYIVSGPGTKKSRDLAANAKCSIAVALSGIDVTLDGTATRVTDTKTLERIAARYRDLGWPVTVERDTFTAPYSAPSAGKPPYYVYRFVLETVVAVAGAEPHGATRWRF